MQDGGNSHLVVLGAACRFPGLEGVTGVEEPHHRAAHRPLVLRGEEMKKKKRKRKYQRKKERKDENTKTRKTKTRKKTREKRGRLEGGGSISGVACLAMFYT